MITAIITGLIYAVSCLLYYAEVALGRIIDFLYDIFMVFVGAKLIVNEGEETYLLDVFFHNGIVSTLYWGMACIGFALIFGFAIVSVVRKLFDYSGEKVKLTYGQIIINVFKSILLIALMTAIVSASITATGVLMDSISYLFDNAEEINDPSEIVFTDEQLGSMFRVIDTISNYGLNPGYDNRFNLNSCYNEVRQDLYELSNSGVFNYTYEGCEDSWQYYLSQLYLASDPTQDIPIDVVNDSVSTALTNIIYAAKNDSNFKPLQSYSRGYSYNYFADNFGKIFMLAGTFGAANNSVYDGESAGFKDQIRGPFYMGAKDIYSKDDVEDYFSLWIGEWRHLTVLLCEIVVLIEFVKMIFNAVARIFNLILLYITAPGFIAVTPLDDGAKFKQWTSSFIITTLNIFGSYISVRLITVFVPIIMSGSLVIFDSGFKNVIAKLLFVLGICLTAQKASGLFSGILSDSGAQSALGSGNIGDQGLSMTGKAVGFAGKTAFKVGGKVLGGAAALGKKLLGGVGAKAFQSMMGKGNGGGGAVRKAEVPAGATKMGGKPDPNSVSNPVDSSKIKDHGQGNGIQNPNAKGPNSLNNPKNEFTPGAINSHFGEKTQGGFTLGGGKGGENLGNSNSMPKTPENSKSDFKDGAISSHYGQKSKGGFRLGENVGNKNVTKGKPVKSAQKTKQPPEQKSFKLGDPKPVPKQSKPSFMNMFNFFGKK